MFDFITEKTTASEIVNHFQGAGFTTEQLIVAVQIYGELKQQAARTKAANLVCRERSMDWYEREWGVVVENIREIQSDESRIAPS